MTSWALLRHRSCLTLRSIDIKRRPLLWLAGVAVVLLLSLAMWPSQSWLAVDFQALLPASSGDKWVAQANREAVSVYERQVLWLVEAGDAASAQDFLSLVQRRLADSGYADDNFESVQLQRWQALSAALYPHRWGLLDATAGATLASDPAAYFQQFQRLLYSPLGGQALSQLESDPTGLFGRYMSAAGAALKPAPAAVTTTQQYTEFSVVSISQDKLGFDALAGLYELFRSLQLEAQQRGLQLHATGVPLYSAYGVHSAKLEMSSIGIVSLLALIALLLWSLRSPFAVMLTVLCVLTGVAGGFLFTVTVLREIHVLTLVFGATLIGIAADYALHYFAHALLPNWNDRGGLEQIYKGLLFGMLSSVVAFGALTILPFPGIRQIGLFMASGLLCSFLTVCMLFPALSQRDAGNLVLPAFCSRSRWQLGSSRLLMLAFVGSAFIGILWLRGVDDVRDFYVAPADLQTAESAIAQHMQGKTESRYLLLQAPDERALLAAEYRVLARLAQLRNQGQLSSFFGITQLLPPEVRQRENHALLNTIDEQGYLAEHMKTLGFGAAAIQATRESLSAEFTPVRSDALTSLTLPLGIGGYLGCDDDGCASWIRLHGIRDTNALSAVTDSEAGLRLVDPVDDINSGINRYRAAVGIMLVVAAFLTLGFLSLVCGIRRALLIVFMPVTACLLSLLLIGLLQGAYTLINLMALLLVFGVGLDYSIFRAFTDESEQAATTLAITLSALTSILAFGMLSFSSTPVISNFGQTIALGLVLAYCLSWIRFDAEPNV